MIHNENIYKSIPFKSGENVRILEDKDMFSKGTINSVLIHIK